MTNPSEQFLFLSSSAPVIFSPTLSPSVSDTTPGPGFRGNTSKRRSRLFPIGAPLILDPTNPGGISRPNKHVVGRRPDPNAPKITSPCSECGKKFWSWKALFGHMRCHPERHWRGMNPPVAFRPRPPPFEPDPYLALSLSGGPEMSEDDHAVATCLLMLANSQPGEPSLSVSSDRKTDNESRDITEHHDQHLHILGHFECSSCRKVFGSHHALGGHRASHKNVNSCFASAMISSSSSSSSLDCCENVMIANGTNKSTGLVECGDYSGASLTTQLVLNSSFATNEACHVDLSLRLGL